MSTDQIIAGVRELTLDDLVDLGGFTYPLLEAGFPKVQMDTAHAVSLLTLATEALNGRASLSSAEAERDEAKRTIGHRDRRIGRLVKAMDFARAQGVRFPADDDPRLVQSGDTLSEQVKSLTEALEAVRSEFKVERHEDGRILSVAHDSGSLRRVIATLDAALASTEAANG
jgi:hypothetical protein